MTFPQFRARGAQRYLCLLLTPLLVVPAELIGQNAPAPGQPAAPAIAPMAPLPIVRSLKVSALAGNGEMNDLENKIMAPIVVEVRDRNDLPVEGADVVFRFPPEGPGAMFPDHKYSQQTKSNFQGQAAAVGWTANNQLGSFKVHVTATYGDQMGESSLTMTNVARITETAKRKQDKKWWSSRWVKIGLIAGGAGLAAGIVLATRGGGSPTVTISTGSPSVGGPR